VVNSLDYLARQEQICEHSLSHSRAVTPVREVLDRLVEESVVGPARLEGFRRAFTLDVRETDHEYIVEAAICSCSDLTLGSCRLRPQDTLSIRTTTTAYQKAEQKPGVYVRREHDMSAMMPMNPEKVSATYEDDVVTFTLPIAAHAKLKQIPVQVKESPSGR
jgi:HSP20 family molecular chaperone IbpA